MSISKNVLGRIFILLGFIMLMMLFAYQTFAADDIAIVEVRRNIPLADDEIIYKDFYINSGTNAGLKKNLVVTAVRKSTVKDAAGVSSIGDVTVPVGKLKIIYAQSNIAIAREYKEISRDEEPMLEQTGIMSGDRIDLEGSFIDTKKLVYKKPVAVVTPPPAPVVAPAVVSAPVAPVVPVVSAPVVAPAPVVEVKVEKPVEPAREVATAPVKVPLENAFDPKPDDVVQPTALPLPDRYSEVITE